jgi:hypothetical protein
MDHVVAENLSGWLAMGFLFGGGALTVIIGLLSYNWRVARVAEQNAVLKKSMIDRGFSADEIARVMTADAVESTPVEAGCGSRKPVRAA